MKRLTIAQMLGIIGVLAVGLGAIQAATEFAHDAFLVATVFGLATALVGALVTGRHRAPWVGFVVFGGATLLLAVGPGLWNPQGPTGPLNRCLDRLFARILRPPPRPEWMTTGQFEQVRTRPEQVASEVDEQLRHTDASNMDETTRNLVYSAKIYMLNLQKYRQMTEYAPRIASLLAAWLAGLVGAIVGGALAGRAAGGERT